MNILVKALTYGTLVGILYAGVDPKPAYGWNPVTDVQNNLVWTAGTEVSIGTAYKLGGSGPARNGMRGDSVMFGIFDYRFLSESYGAINDPNGGGKLGDGLKTGLLLNYFLGWFKNPETPVMKALQNVNVGPVITTPILSSDHPFKTIDYWVEANLKFGQ